MKVFQEDFAFDYKDMLIYIRLPKRYIPFLCLSQIVRFEIGLVT